MSSSIDRGIKWYDEHAGKLANQYEQVDFEQVHGWLIDFLPPSNADAQLLDIGAGSGRDAFWLAASGYEVVAVEPAQALREEAQQLHPHARLHWVADSLPELAEVHRLARNFDLVLLSAVWMHVPPEERNYAFRQLLSLLKPGGVLAITLRLGEPDIERGMHAVSSEEFRQLAAEHEVVVEHISHSPDALGREGVSWAEVLIRHEQLLCC